MATLPTAPAISRRVATLKPSVTIAFNNRAKAMQQQGIDVLGFAAGEPDFDTPVNIKKAAIDALNAGQTKYMPTLGDPATRAAIAKKLTEENGLPNVTADHVGVSAGGKHALYVICQCVFDTPEHGEAPAEAIIPVPAWVSYAPLAEIAGAKVVEVPTTPATGFKMTPAQLKAAITPRSRLLILNSPSNPCGTMYTPDELRALAAVVDEAARTTAPGLLVLSDEIYEKIAYGGIPHFSIGSIPAIAERVITINGMSKAYAMTGWRLGYTAASGAFGKKFMGAMATMQGQMSTNITSFTYPAIREALAHGAAEVEKMRQAFASRAELIISRLRGIADLATVTPVGAFYVFPDVSKFFGKRTPKGTAINSSLEFCEALLAEKHVAFVPGEDFGGCGGNHARISFACSEQQINKGMDRLAEFVQGLK